MCKHFRCCVAHAGGEKRNDLPLCRLVGLVSTLSETHRKEDQAARKGAHPGQDRRLPGVATHTQSLSELRFDLGWGPGQPRWVAIDCITGGSRSSSIKAVRRLNVQSGKRRGKVNKCCGHLARALPSVIVGTVCGKPMGSLK